MKKIGIFSSFVEPAALELVEKIVGFVNEQYPSQAKVSFIFSNRELGESPVTDKLLQRLQTVSMPLMSFSAARFEPERRKTARALSKSGDDSSIDLWRNDYAEEVIKLLPPTDFDLLIGDWWIWGEKLCLSRTGLNLHPALPGGPKGEWFNVIWELIRQNARESGIMMHKVIPELDRGPVATYCRYSIRGPVFDDLWINLPINKKTLDLLIEEESKKNEGADYPLHVAIRNEGFKREIPLILSTVSSLIKDEINIGGKTIKDKAGKALQNGYDLSSAVNLII
jgi:phosphoribosylglycinamide formyltransferase-1